MVRDSVPLPSSSNASAPVTAEAKASQAGSIQASNGRTREAVVRDIVNGLYDGRYEPGQRLQEAQLTAAYGISRGPVREALNALSAMGIVDLTPQRGAQVRVLGIEEAIDTLIVAQALISLSARLAATRASQSSQRDRLVRSLEAILAGRPREAEAAARTHVGRASARLRAFQ